MPPPATQTADPSPSVFTKVKLVGMVLNKAEGVNEICFLLDDGIGRIDCLKWYTSFCYSYIFVFVMWFYDVILLYKWYT
ncbi:hypothetical protein HanRHA438_Chr11g0516861 [Helianthus annuus]|nr:hypothetical protein HanIR_Chr11g0542751 [Helianthus annuus]KAJ0518466.1 hypothetical protein HanHA89_Chr11g0437791 [Helianthus annuus]KAJ0686502.1 hypothetical protein HanLR1_Chr11g0415491 [Helianthus annuus]KAJ0690318.1 hypothetical protein HanOQP8_Chr11g0416511 [Helianthus annuus]KAJ0815740.1 hypothetical protein HanPI659440_Chr00c39g0740081 [Helianthus annuus]